MAIGEPIPMLDSTARVTGQLDYLINLKLPGMLVAKIVRSQVPHGRLIRVDVQEALKVPGVTAILTGDDLPPGLKYGIGVRDQPVVSQDRVRFIGEPVAVIVAENMHAAEEAYFLIDIEYEELPAVFDVVEANQPNAPMLHKSASENVFKHAKLRHGDLEVGFAEADAIFEGTFTSPVAQQASLEPNVSIAKWDGDKLQVWSATQAPHRVRGVLAETFEIDLESVRVIGAPLGGGYGGKGHIRMEPLVAAAARKTPGRPVKLVLSRAEMFVTVTKHAAVMNIKTGVRSDGSMTARKVDIYWNVGAYADASAFLVSSGMVRSAGPYRIPAVHLNSYGIYTNLPPSAAFRGAMSSQTTWAYESHMDIIARKMGWDPYEFRQKNILRDGDEFATGEKMHDVHFEACLKAVVDALKEDESSPSVQHPGGKRGSGHAVMMKSMPGKSTSKARLSLDQFGQATLFTSTVEMGQGAHTALAQIAADALDMHWGDLQVVGPDTDKTPFDSSTSASRSTSNMGNAIVDAAKQLKEKLVALASPILEVAPENLATQNSRVIEIGGDGSVSYGDILKRNQIDMLEATGVYTTNFGIDPETGQGIATPHWHQGAGAVEVAVDEETGKVSLLRYYASAFAGNIVNPVLAKLQNDGNVIYGLGPALYEEMIFDGGQVTNPNFSDYMIPSFRDLPLVLESMSLESDSGEIHGIGEMTLPSVAPAIANAIEDAVGIRIKDLPITPEKVLRALREKDR